MELPLIHQTQVEEMFNRNCLCHLLSKYLYLYFFFFSVLSLLFCCCFGLWLHILFIYLVLNKVLLFYDTEFIFLFYQSIIFPSRLFRVSPALVRLSENEPFELKTKLFCIFWQGSTYLMIAPRCFLSLTKGSHLLFLIHLFVGFFFLLLLFLRRRWLKYVNHK